MRAGLRHGVCAQRGPRHALAGCGWLASIVVLLLSAPLALPAVAKTGDGDFFRRTGVNRVVRFEPLSRHGGDAVRVTYVPFDRIGWSIELHPRSPNAAIGGVAFSQVTRHGDLFTGWQRLDMNRRAYDALLAKVDAVLARGDPPEFNAEQPGEMIVCSDGDNYTVERRKHGTTRWVQEDCGYDLPARDVVELMVAAFPFPLCWYVTFPSEACEAVRAPHQGP